MATGQMLHNFPSVTFRDREIVWCPQRNMLALGMGGRVNRESIFTFRWWWRVSVAPRVAKVPKQRSQELGRCEKLIMYLFLPGASLLDLGWGHVSMVRWKNMRVSWLSENSFHLSSTDTHEDTIWPSRTTFPGERELQMIMRLVTFKSLNCFL